VVRRGRKHTDAKGDNAGLDCIPFTRPGEGNDIRECNTSIIRAGRVEAEREKGSEGDCGPASDRPARQRWRRKVVSEIKKKNLNRMDVLDSGRMINEGERGAPMFDAKRLK